MTHAYLPDEFNINPSIPYSVEKLPDGQKDILIPSLVSKQQITVSYLYYPPTTVNQIHAGIRCDQGIATPVEMEVSEKMPKWTIIVAGILAVIGLGTILRGAWWLFQMVDF